MTMTMTTDNPGCISGASSAPSPVARDLTFLNRRILQAERRLEGLREWRDQLLGRVDDDFARSPGCTSGASSGMDRLERDLDNHVIGPAVNDPSVIRDPSRDTEDNPVMPLVDQAMNDINDGGPDNIAQFDAGGAA